MKKRNLFAVGVFCALLVFALSTIGCENLFGNLFGGKDSNPGGGSDSITDGRIRISTGSDTTDYWVLSSHNMEEIGRVSKNSPWVISGIDKEGSYTVYYCERYDGETQGDLDGRIWIAKPPVHVTLGKIAEMTIP